MGLQQAPGALGHPDVPEPLGQDQGEAQLLGPGDGNAEVAAEQLAQVLVVEAAHHHRRHPELARALQRLVRGVRASDDQLAAVGRVQALGTERLVGRLGDDRDLAEGLAAHSEDSLDEGGSSLDHHAFVRQHLGHHPAHVGVDLDRHRRLAQDELPGDVRDALDGPLDRRHGRVGHEAEQALGRGDHLPSLHLASHRPPQRPGDLGRIDR